MRFLSHYCVFLGKILCGDVGFNVGKHFDIEILVKFFFKYRFSHRSTTQPSFLLHRLNIVRKKDNRKKIVIAHNNPTTNQYKATVIAFEFP